MNDSFFDHRSEASGRYDYPKEIAFDHASMLRELWIVFSRPSRNQLGRPHCIVGVELSIPTWLHGQSLQGNRVE